MGILIGGQINIGGQIWIGDIPIPVSYVLLVEENQITQIVSEPGSGSQNIIEE